MLGHRELTMQDYTGILKRRFWLILISAVLFLGVGIGLTYIIPPQYMSQTLVIIEQQQVPTSYVMPVVTQDLGSRLASMREQILSRSRLQPIIEKFNLFAGHGATMDDRIEMTQKAIEVKPIPSSNPALSGMPGFFVSFKAPDAHTAQQVCGEITSLFLSENLSTREQSAEGTTDFLKQQLADAKAKLDDQDAKLAAFEEKNFGLIPEEGQNDNGTLQALTIHLDTVTQSLGHDQQEVSVLQAAIAQQTRDPQGIEAGAPSVDERKAELKALIEQKQTLEAQYTPDHPDVIAISRKIEDLQAEIAHASAEPAPAPAPAAPPVSRGDPPQLQQLKAQLRAAEASLAAAKQEQARIEQQIRGYEGRIQSRPEVGAEYKQITRDHQMSVDSYNSLLKKINESSMATALEQAQEGEQFRVLDPANLPDAPSFPIPGVFAGGGFAFGLLLGLLVVALLEYRDTTLHNERDIWAFTKLPTLAVISRVKELPQPVKPHTRWKLFSRTNKPVESALG
ncbi:MAG: Wzz/FepE/Etk N-terminal domain-containing protein [Terracidiphilus sp.]|jgi:polysaccharide chain length determinant protein (PEP-CTERM system associated)